MVNRWYPSQSMVEMLVVLSVFTLLTGMVVSFSRTGQAQSQLSRQVDLLITDIRRTQENAYFARAAASGTVPCGYGISFATSSYVIGTVTQPQNDCAQIASYQFQPATDVSDYKRTLSNAISFDSVSSNPIVFVKPAPHALFYPDAQEATITLTARGVASQRITINMFGGIQVQ